MRSSKSPEWRSWRSMRARCLSPKATAFENYGGRGITICERWGSFANFFADMGERPTIHHTLDRIDNNGPYEPGNCRWATRTEQNRDKRSLVMLTIDGETMCLRDWARRFSIDESTVQRRLRLGWETARAVRETARTTARTKALQSLTIDGETAALTIWAQRYKIRRPILLARIRDGWDPKRAVTTPVEQKRPGTKPRQER